MDIKHIFFVIHEYSGANTYAGQLREFLTGRAGIRFYIIHFGSMQYKEFTVIEKNDIIIFHIPFPGKRDLNIYSRRVVDILTPWLQDKKELILHLNSPNQHFLGRQVKERFGAKVIYTVHFLMSYFTACADDYTYENDSFQDCTGNRETIALSDQVICVTKFACRVTELYFRKERERIKLIYNGSGSEKQIISISHTQKMELRRKLGFAENEVLLLYVGRIDETKGCEKLIQAVGRLIPKYEHIRLILAGSGNYGESLKHVGLNCTRITFSGHLPVGQLEQLYRIADIGVIPSLWEQCSYVAIEMMAYGLPIVYTGVPGLRELFTDGVNGVQLPFHRDTSKYKLSVDVQDLEHVLSELFEHPEITEKLGLWARSVWLNRFTRVMMGEQMLLLYQNINQ